MKYNVPVKWLATGYVEVEAEDAEDLLRKLFNESFVNGLPFLKQVKRLNTHIQLISTS